MSLINNGTFDTGTSGWTPVNAILASVAGQLKVTNNSANFGLAYQMVTVAIGQSYKIQWDAPGGTSGPLFRVGNSINGSEYVNATASGAGQSFTFVPTQTTIYVSCVINDNVVNDYTLFDNIILGGAGETRLTTADILVATSSKSPEARITAADVLVAYNLPSQQERISNAAALATVKSTMPLRVTEAAVLVAVKGRTANPKLRAWTFTLDGHDFYVLRLGDTLTLVYDVYSEQWMDWDAFGETYWPVNKGINWVGGTGILEADGSSPGSNVLVGDDTYGLLWFLNPMQPYDENPEIIDPALRYFTRTIMGQVPMVGRENLPCYSVWLTTDMGAPAYLGAGVTLSISDDGGATFSSMGLVSVTPGNNSPELSWYSLGQIQAPGRLFKIVDDGAVTRIDAMEMNDPDAK